MCFQGYFLAKERMGTKKLAARRLRGDRPEFDF